MKVDLDKKALISLVCGQSPGYSIMGNDTIKKHGSYSDNRGWTWDTIRLMSITETELYELYKLCRNSWGDEYSMTTETENTENTYTKKQVCELLSTQRGNCYVAVLNQTGDKKAALRCVTAPEPAGGKF